MIYLVGVLGFIGGFVLGQVILGYLLKGRSREELLNDKYLKWKYGTLNWLIAALGSASAVMLYERIFILGS